MQVRQFSTKLLLPCLLGFSLILAGQSAPSSGKAAPSVDPKKAAIIEEVFRVTKPESLIQQALEQYKAAFSQAATQGFNQEVRKFDDPAKYQADFNRLQDRVFGLLNQRLSWQKIKPQFAQVYADTFSTDELTGLLTFYRSPAGQAFLTKTPTLMAKFSAIGQQQMAGAGPEIQKIMSDFMADLKKRSAAAHPNANAPAKK